MTAESENKHTKVEQNDPQGKVLQSFQPGVRCDEQHVVSMWQPTVIIDSHMHIQSGRCAPLQYVQSLSVVTSTMSRGWIEESGRLGGRFLECFFEPVMASTRALGYSSSDAPKNPQDGFFRVSPLRKLSEQSQKATWEIAVDFMNERDNAYNNYFKIAKFYEGATNLVLSSVVMTMDMEYAHIDGYFGIKVYNALYESEEDVEKNDPIAYWTPRHGRWVKKTGSEAERIGDYTNGRRGGNIYVKIESENCDSLPETREAYRQYERSAEEHGIVGGYFDSTTGKKRQVRIGAIPVLLPAIETKRYENWKKQMMHTEHAVLANPLKLLPMFHYDPRRWQESGNKEPMSKVTGQGIYLGFKMYTAQGYRPWDPWLPVLEDFYAKCCQFRIPIMNHCTPGGAATFEREDYRDFEHPSNKDAMQKEGKSKLEYFNEHYVSPEAWKKVLDKTAQLAADKTSSTRTGVDLHNLHICLAHFGGPTKRGLEWNQQIIEMINSEEYPNLYTDISSSFADNGFREHFKKIMTENSETNLKNRILFGTDWFLTFFYSLVPSVGKNFWDYCVETKMFLDSFDTSLWPAFTQYNPYRFYRLDEQIERIAENIIVERQTPEIADKLGELKQNKISEIQKETAYIKFANRSYVHYEETP